MPIPVPHPLVPIPIPVPVLVPVPVPSPIAIGHTLRPLLANCRSASPPASHWSAAAPARLRRLIGQRQRRRLRLAEAQRAGAAVGRWLGPARLSPQPAPLPTRAAPHGPAAAAAVRRSCPGSPEPEVRHDGSGAEDSGAGGVRENGSGTGPGSGTVRGPPLGRGRICGSREGCGLMGAFRAVRV